MKIGMLVNEIVDGKVDFVSLVKHGANRSPFKIVKAEDAREVAPRQKVEADEVSKLQTQLHSLNEQWANLQEQCTNPFFERLNDDLEFEICKTELALAALDPARNDTEMSKHSAFIRRGGSSGYAQATAYDSAFRQRQTAMKKAEAEVDLRDNGLTTTDEREVAKVDLSSFAL